MFTSSISTMLDLTFMSVIYFKLILHMVRYIMTQSFVLFLHKDIKIFQHQCWKHYPFSMKLLLHLCQESIIHICVGLFLDPVSLSLIYLNGDFTFLERCSFNKALETSCTSPLNLFFLKVILAILNPLYFHV